MKGSSYFRASARGLYVVLEGVDTCGKSTQIQNVRGIFKDAIFTKEPGASALGAEIRKLILDSENSLLKPTKLAELFLFLADRAQHFEQIIKPALDSEKLVISDRSLISGIAYADLDFENLARLNAIAMQGVKPDLCIFLRLDSENLQKRLAQKSHDNIESRGIEYLLAVQDRIAHTAQMLGIELLEIDASECKAAIARQIENKILQVLECRV